MLFHYKAIKDGAVYEADKEAADKIALYKDVRKEGGTIISAEEKSERRYFWSRLSRGVKLEQKISFAKNLAVMLDAGISVNRALSIMSKQAKSKKLADIFISLSDSINKGKTLSDSMRDHKDVFSDLFVMMTKSGEESGKLSESLRVIAAQLERANTLTKKIKGAMIYPIIVVCVMVILGVLLLVYMVPTLTETFKGLGIKLPLPTRIVIAMSDFLRSSFLLLAIFVAGLGAGIWRFFKTPKGKRAFDYAVLHMPIVSSISKEINSARTARTISSLISSGVNIVSALDVAKDVVQNSYYKEVLRNAGESLQKGGTLSSILNEASDLYPVYVGEMTAVGEETGELSTMLSNIANYYEAEVDEKTKNLSTMLEPLLMVFIGIAVGLFAVSMLLPTYSLVDAIQ
jgi:type IV pilus assembly protein PilC